MYKILVINPGSTSTELNIFEDEKEIKNARIVHPVDELRKCENVIDQFPYRSEIIHSTLSDWGIKKGDLSAVVGRSGPYQHLFHIPHPLSGLQLRESLVFP